MADTLIREAPPGTWVDSDGSVRTDRRRPGRREVDPALIPLLRGQAPIVEDEVAAAPALVRIMDRDELSAPIGIAVGTAACLIGWAGMAFSILR